MIRENAVVTLPILLSMSADPGCLLTPAACLAAYEGTHPQSTKQIYIGSSSNISVGITTLPEHWILKHSLCLQRIL